MNKILKKNFELYKEFKGMVSITVFSEGRGLQVPPK